jgi:hypothetical protein
VKQKPDSLGQDFLLDVGQADVIFRKAARCGFGTADVFQLGAL